MVVVGIVVVVAMAWLMVEVVVVGVADAFFFRWWDILFYCRRYIILL